MAGVVVFYHAALQFGSRRNAFLAALAYSSISYIRLRGRSAQYIRIADSLPILLFYVLLNFDSDRAPWRMWLAVCIFAIGAGFRPTDGLFLIPMLAFFCFSRMPRKQGAFYLGLLFALILCSALIIPTGLAYRHAYVGMRGVLAYMLLIVRARSITTGVNAGTMANVVRYALPLLVAFFGCDSQSSRKHVSQSQGVASSNDAYLEPFGSLFFVFSVYLRRALFNFSICCDLVACHWLFTHFGCHYRMECRHFSAHYPDAFTQSSGKYLKH